MRTRAIYIATRILPAMLFAFCLNTTLHAQSARLYFEADTFAIGRPVPLRLEITHPSNQTIIFPQENTAFAPFERIRTEAIPTVTSGSQSVDAAIYYVSSFELYSEQRASLPWAFVQDNGDTVLRYAESNTIRLNRRARPENTELRADTATLFLQDDPDYVIVGLLLVGIFLVLVLAVVLLRKPVMRYYAQRHVRREWQQLRARMSELSRQLDKPAIALDGMTQLWKETLYFGTRQPLRSFTTTELIPIIRKQATLTPAQQETLIQSCIVTDNVLFAGSPAPAATALTSMYEGILDVLRQDYVRRRDAIG